MKYSEVYKAFSKVEFLDGEVRQLPRGIRYLPWSTAWRKVLELYPASQYRYGPVVHLADGSAMVSCTVEIWSEDGEQDVPLVRSESLPVLNGNKAAINPDAAAINKAQKRCLVKCLALFGLVLWLYEGEEEPTISVDETRDSIEDLLERASEAQVEKFWATCGTNVLADVPASKLKAARKWLREQIA